MSKPVHLEFGAFGSPEKPPLLILHGLLGSSRNWLSIGKVFAEHFNTFILDLRNHGSSPHTETITFDEMVDDLEHWITRKKLPPFYILGHSLGGKVSMAFACRNAERVKGLIVEDIAPKAYDLRYEQEFKLMNELDLSKLKSRTDADNALAEGIKDFAWRQFLLTNLTRDKESKEFKWNINLPTLTRCLPSMMENSLKDGERYEGPTLFLRGEQSDFIGDEDYAEIRNRFPRNAIVKIPNSGHNVHIDNTEALVKAIVSFKEHQEKG